MLAAAHLQQLEQVLYFAKYIVIDPGDAMLLGEPLKKGQLLNDEEYRELKFGRQETYSIPDGAQALVIDGTYVTKDQELAPGVISKMDGFAMYRFPRRISVAYTERERAHLVLPEGAWIDRQTYAPSGIE